MTKKEYETAVDTLNAWAKAYYTDDVPIATDEEYDELYHKVLDFERSIPAISRCLARQSASAARLARALSKLVTARACGRWRIFLVLMSC